MTLLKSLILRALPDQLIFRAKRLHYPGVIRGYRPPHATILHALVASGDHVVDIGANVGWYTRALSDLVGPDGRVFSIEPVPPTFALLSHCVRRLGLRNVELFNCAMSDRTGAAVMEVPHYSAGGENFYTARIVDGPPDDARLRTFPVVVTSLDALLASRRHRIAFVKCDVEGHELAVVKGALATLARWKPAMLIEVSGDPDHPTSAAHALMAELETLGYAAYRFDGQGVAQRRAGQRAVDYFFLDEDHVAGLRRAAVPVT